MATLSKLNFSVEDVAKKVRANRDAKIKEHERAIEKHDKEVDRVRAKIAEELQAVARLVVQGGELPEIGEDWKEGRRQQYLNIPLKVKITDRPDEEADTSREDYLLAALENASDGRVTLTAQEAGRLFLD